MGKEILSRLLMMGKKERAGDGIRGVQLGGNAKTKEAEAKGRTERLGVKRLERASLTGMGEKKKHVMCEILGRECLRASKATNFKGDRDWWPLEGGGEGAASPQRKSKAMTSATKQGFMERTLRKGRAVESEKALRRIAGQKWMGSKRGLQTPTTKRTRGCKERHGRNEGSNPRPRRGRGER